MKKSMLLTLSDEGFIGLQRITLSEDKERALRFLQERFKDKVRAVLEGEGHCKPHFEIRGQ
jgi:hypothetical protein